MGKWFHRLKSDPVNWLLDKSCPSIRFRTLTEILGRPVDDHDVARARQDTRTYKPATTITGDQSDDGTWFHSLLGFEPRNAPRKRGPGTASQLTALIEFGWSFDDPILYRSQELFDALVMSANNVDLYELKGYSSGPGPVESYMRRRLARSALAFQVRAGRSDVDFVSKKIQEFLEELDAVYRGDPHANLYVGQHRRQVEGDNKTMVEEVCEILSPEAPPPDHTTVMTLAFSPQTRQTALGRDVAKRVSDYIFSRPAPEHEVVEVGNKFFNCDSRLSIRNLDRQGFGAAKLVGRLLQELELLARLGTLESIPKAVDLLEWIIDMQDAEGIVRADDVIEKTVNRIDYPYFPLEDNWRGKHKKFTDTTFRLLLILSLLDPEGLLDLRSRKHEVPVV